MQRDLTRLALIQEQIKAIEQARLARLEQAPQTGPKRDDPDAGQRRGLGIETAEMLVQEVLSRNLRCQSAREQELSALQKGPLSLRDR